MRALIDEGPLLPARAVAAGLVDKLGYQDEADAELRAVSGSGARATIDLATYARVDGRALGLNRGPRIAVIHASGAITSGRSGFDPLNGQTVGADTLNGYLRRVRRDPRSARSYSGLTVPGGRQPPPTPSGANSC